MAISSLEDKPVESITMALHIMMPTILSILARQDL
jgi:hypothetical protein